MLSDKITLQFITAPSDYFHRIFTGVLCGAQNFPWVMPLSNPDPPSVKKMIFTRLVEIWSLFTRILNFRLSLGISLGWIPPVVYYY